jgi:hypothetical protein
MTRKNHNQARSTCDTPVLKKHTKNFDLNAALTLGVDNIQRNFEPMVQAVEPWRGHQLTDVQAKQVIYEAYVEGTEVMATTRAAAYFLSDRPA